MIASAPAFRRNRRRRPQAGGAADGVRTSIAELVPAGATHGWGRLRAWLTASVVLVVALGCVGFEKRDETLVWLLRSAIDAWVVNDRPEKADAIVVLAGNTHRAETAARLWREGYAPVVLVSNCGRDERDMSQVNTYKAVLRAAGVPDSAMRALPGLAKCTFHEASNLARWVRENQADTVIVVTDACHTRRAKWLCRNERDLAPIRLLAVPCPAGDVPISELWRHPAELRFFFREVTRYAFYRAFWPRGGLEAARERGELKVGMSGDFEPAPAR
jgi:uncharacterized SAM-binding protein YcdF (DUF218 family)